MAAAANAAGRLCTSADTLWFGQQYVGTRAASTVTVQKCGDAAFAFTDVGIRPATNAAFHVDTACRTGPSLALGATCAIAAWPRDAADSGAVPVCRFFGTPGVGPNSHFYTGYAFECDAVRRDGQWIEEGVTFRARLPGAGACANDERTVLRLWKPGASVTRSRHRYVVDAPVAATMQTQGFVVEGAVFCAPAG
jgi:hypothetical protein